MNKFMESKSKVKKRFVDHAGEMKLCGKLVDALEIHSPSTVLLDSTKKSMDALNRKNIFTSEHTAPSVYTVDVVTEIINDLSKEKA